MKRQTQTVETAARQLIEQARRRLSQELPELLPVIYYMKAAPAEAPGALRSDGVTLFYHPESVVRDCLADRGAAAAQLLHVLCHGLLGHFGRRKGQLAPLYDAAADISAARLAARLCRKYGKGRDAASLAAYPDSAEAIYLSAGTKEEMKALIERAKPFRVDDHGLWDRPPEESPGAPGPEGEAARAAWESVAARTAEGLARAGKGDAAGMLSELYREVGCSTVSYAEFLRRFCALRERPTVDPDSIDRIWYRVGLDLNGDTPIVEPEELREERRLEHIAVAVDTSGSCAGDVLEGFLRELLALLRDGGGPRAEFTLIQCDSKIQKVETLSAEDFAGQLAAGMRFDGWGGTDFRPVFDYVSAQRTSEDGVDFTGLLYFTDGWGDYPAEEPDYPVAFFFPRGEADWGCGFGCACPDWITKVYITPEGALQIDEENKGGAFQ